MRIGEYLDLRIERETQHGLYLTDGQDEVLLPRGQCPRKGEHGTMLHVFVYTDSEDRPVATIRKPHATVGQFAKLTVVSVTSAGAFLDWGIDKDLFCPLREQYPTMIEGNSYLVRIYLDEVSQRVTCTTKLGRFLHSDGAELSVGQAVKMLVAGRAADRLSVILNDSVRASLFADEMHERLEIGSIRDAYVKSIRAEDRKVAVSLRPQGYDAVLGERERLLKAIAANGGSIPVSDKSSPEEIHQAFGLSKGAFKKLIGSLYKEGKLIIEADCIRLNP